jgi:predicted exporter
MNYGLVLIGALMVAFALFYFRAAESEDAPAALWAGLSIGMSLLCWRVLKLGWLGISLGQVVLFFGITAVRSLRKD